VILDESAKAADSIRAAEVCAGKESLCFRVVKRLPKATDKRILSDELVASSSSGERRYHAERDQKQERFYCIADPSSSIMRFAASRGSGAAVIGRPIIWFPSLGLLVASGSRAVWG
jgi:hypothetical protein